MNVVTTRNVRFHGWTMPKGTVREAVEFNGDGSVTVMFDGFRRCVPAGAWRQS